jgi:ferredoxin-NADP reductase
MVDGVRIGRRGVYLLAGATFAAIIGFWWDSSGSSLFSWPFGTALAIGRVAALVAVYLVLTQVIIASGAEWVEQEFGFPRLKQLSNQLIAPFLLLLILHIVLITYGYSGGIINPLTQLEELILNFSGVGLAAVAAVIFLAVGLVALYPQRLKVSQEVQTALSVCFYAAILLAFAHQVALGADFNLGSASLAFSIYWYLLYLFAATNLLYYRVGQPLWHLREHKFKVKKVVSEAGGAFSIYITGDHLGWFDVLPGQFAYFRFLDNQRWWRSIELCVSAMDVDDLGGQYLRVTVKPTDEFSTHLRKLAPSTQVSIDGPYGVFTTDNSSRGKYLFIASGMGIAPVRYLLDELADKGTDIVLVHESKSTKEAVFASEIEKLERKFKNLKVVDLYASEAANSSQYGLIDKAFILKNAADLQEREAFVSGPADRVKQIAKTLSLMGFAKDNLHELVI